jgi:tetratricopeptide (TPR) repeat protein
MMDLLSTEQERLVGSLHSELDVVRSTGRVRVVVLEGPIGIGKTRVVQEFHRALAIKQDAPRYWPTDAFSSSLTATGDDVRSARKRIAPQPQGFTAAEPGAAMPWMWWGLRCPDDPHAEAITGDDPQLRAHCVALLTRRLAKKDGTRAVKDLLLTLGGVLLPPVSMIQTALDVPTQLKDIARHLRAGSRPVRAIDHKEQVGRVIKLVNTLSSAEMPFVIALEDAHRADHTITDAIAALVARKNMYALIVCTAWTDALAHQAHDRPDDSLGGLLTRLESSGTDEERVVTRAELPPLRFDDVAQIFRATAPDTPSRTLDALVRKASGNPLCAQSLLALRSVQGSIRGGAITLDAETVARRLPNNWQEIGEAHWTQLSDEQRLTVHLSSMQGMQFHGQLTRDAVAALFADAPALHLDSDDLAHWFVREDAPDGELFRFTERLLYDIAGDERHRLSEDEQFDVRALWVERVTAHRRAASVWPTMTANVRACLLRLMLESAIDLQELRRDLADEIDERDGFPTPQELVQSCDELRGLELEAGRPQQALDAAQLAVFVAERLHTRDSPEFRQTHLIYGTLCRTMGDYARAHTVFARQVKTVRRELNVSPEDGGLKRELAECLIEATTPMCDLGKWDEALETGREAAAILDDLAPSAADRSTLLAHGNNAIFLRCLAERDGAPDLLTEAMAEHRHVQTQITAATRDLKPWADAEAELTDAELGHGLDSQAALHAAVDLGAYHLYVQGLAPAEYHLRRALSLLQAGRGGADDVPRAQVFLGLVLKDRQALVEAAELLTEAATAVRDGRLSPELYDGFVPELRDFLQSVGRDELAALIPEATSAAQSAHAPHSNQET